MQRVLQWFPVAAWAALIFVLSSESEPPQPATLAGLPGWSSAAHFGLYFVLGALLYRALLGAGGREPGAGEKTQTAGKNPYLQALAAGALYAASDEVHQYFVPLRQADPVDWLVDIAGVLVGALAVLAWERRRGKF